MTLITISRCVALAATLACLVAPQRGRADTSGAHSQNDPVRATLIADVNTIAPGATFQLGVHLVVDDGWYLNWSNPGDNGLAPSIEWTVPDGFKAGMLEWPHPERHRAGANTIFGYRDSVMLVTQVQAPDELSPGSRLEFGAGVSWVACGDGFLPGGADLTLELRGGNTTEIGSRNEWFNETQQRIPVPPTSWRFTGWYHSERQLILEFQSGDPASPSLGDVFFYPYDPRVIDNGAPQILSRIQAGDATGGYRLVLLTRDRRNAARPARLRGVMVSRDGWRPGGTQMSLSVEIHLPNAPR